MLKYCSDAEWKNSQYDLIISTLDCDIQDWVAYHFVTRISQAVGNVQEGTEIRQQA